MTVRRILVALWIAGGIAALGWAASRDFARQGDGWEYLATTEALARHGSPDVRDADVAAMSAAVDAWLTATVGPTQPGSVRGVIDGELAHRFATTADGRRYAMHFWLYPLSAVPARLALAATGRPVFNALVVTNVLLLTLALGAALFLGRGDEVQRLALALMLVATPVVWYAAFTGVEVFCWAFVVAALVALDRDRYGTSAVLASVAAAQNPPLAVLVLVPMALAVSHRQWRSAGHAMAGVAITCLPIVFYATTFGVPSLLTRAHVDLEGVSLARTASLFLDLDLGLLPYVPVLVVLLPVAVWRIARTRSARGAWLVAALLGAMAVAETQTNWNSAGMGLHRYLVWILPILTWIVADGCTPRGRWIAAAALVVTSGTALALERPDETNWLAHRAAARWMLREAPAWYHQEFEVFAERSAHAEAPPGWMVDGRRDGWTELLPVAHGRASGEVTTLLVHAGSAARLRERFRVDDAYWPTLLAIASSHATPVYVHPPAGTVWTLHDPVDGTYQPATVAAVRLSTLQP